MPTEKQVTYTLYQFDELSDKAKEKARDWYRKVDGEMFDSDDFGENALKEPAAYYHRVKTEKLGYGLSYCQGDGVAFYGRFDLDFFMAKPGDEGAPEDGGPLNAERVALQEMVRKLRDGGFYTINVNIASTSNHYSHWNTMRVEVETEQDRDGPDLETLKDEFESGLNDYMKHVSRDIEKRGYAELDYRASAECVDENIRANEYTFSESGNRLEV